MTNDTIPSIPDTFTVRIVRDMNNKDGWVARTLADSNNSGKIAFIKNIDSLIQDLMPGQLWFASLIEEKPKFSIINLDHMIRS